MRHFLFLLLLSVNVCTASEWKNEINSKLDNLGNQFSDGCTEEVKDARKLYSFKNKSDDLYAAMISVEGQHCGNGNIEYLIVYQLGYGMPKDEKSIAPAGYWLVGFAVIGGRGERSVDFNSLKFNHGIFTMDAKRYGRDDAMCCPSLPIILKYKLSFYGLNEL